MSVEQAANSARYKIFKYLPGNGDAVMYGSVTQRYMDNWPTGGGLEIIVIPDEFLSGPNGEGDASPDEYYVDVYVSPPVVRPSPPMDLTINKTEIAADGIDYVEISGFPLETQIHLPDGSTIIEDGDGVLQWSTAVPGEFRIYWTHYRFLNGEVIVSAT